MRHFLSPVFILIFSTCLPLFASNIPDSKFLGTLPQQKISSSYNKDFGFKHDKGFFLAASIGPQWNQSIQNPDAGAFRFGGRVALGWVAVENLAIHGGLWGAYLKEASMFAVGPGVTYFFGESNVGLGAQVGIGQVSGEPTPGNNFRETVLAGELNIGKYWWLSKKNSLGLVLATGLYGFTLTQGATNSVGWNTGLRLEYVFN